MIANEFQIPNSTILKAASVRVDPAREFDDVIACGQWSGRELARQPT